MDSMSGVSAKRLEMAKSSGSYKGTVKTEKEECPAPKDEVVLTGSKSKGKGAGKLDVPTSGKVDALVYAQDALVAPQERTKIDHSSIGFDLNGSRVKVSDKGKQHAVADADGNYLYEAGKPESTQVNSFVPVQKTLDLMENYAGHKIEWAFGDEQITVRPDAGQMENAYYYRPTGSLNFFHFRCDEMGKNVKTGESADVVAHEAGHAILDGMRPNFLTGFATETAAFHEAFGDISSLFYGLSFDSNIDRVADETKGNLKMSNVLANDSEEFGYAIRLNKGEKDPKKYLRTSINSWTYTPPSELPGGKIEDKLTSECHNFARLFNGAFYDCFTNVYNKNLEEISPEACAKKEPKKADIMEALKTTRDALGPVVAKSIDLMPPSSVDYKTAALCMLKADDMVHAGMNKTELSTAFKERKILTNEDIKNFEAEQKNLPDVKFKGVSRDEKSLMEFLEKNQEKLGVSPDTFDSAKAVKDKKGNTFVSYSSNKEYLVSLEGSNKILGQSMVLIPVAEGMTLAFDKSGELMSKTLDLANENKVNNILDSISEAEEKGEIRAGKGNTNPLNEKNQPYMWEAKQGRQSSSSAQVFSLTGEPVQAPANNIMVISRIPIMAEG